MKVLVIVAHPNKSSFNPILPFGEFPQDAVLLPDIQRHCDEVSLADGVVIIHPNWWGQPPATWKGWVDRVIRPGVACEFPECDTGEGVLRGLLKTDCVIIFNTLNTETTREKIVIGDPIETIWKICIFDLCSVKTFHRRMIAAVAQTRPHM